MTLETWSGTTTTTTSPCPYHLPPGFDTGSSPNPGPWIPVSDMMPEVASEDNTETAYPMRNLANYVQIWGETMRIIRIIVITITNDSSHFHRS